MTNPKKNNDVKFAFFGTPKLACVFLDELAGASLVPSLVVTVPDKPRGRGLEVVSPPTKEWAEKRKIPVLQPEKLDDEFYRQLSAVNCELFIVIYYGKVLPRAVLDIPRHGTLNIHFSLLPRWRGTSPVRAAIANDDREVGISIILLDEKIDHGPVIAQKKLVTPEWPPKASELEETATHESAKLLINILPSWLEGDIEAREQNHDIATLCPKYTKEDALLDLNGDPYKNLLKIRAFDTTVGTHAFFERNGKKIRVGILDAHIENEKLVIDIVKPEGKKEMVYQDFLRSGARAI
ncbi:MAG: methionyl-tRNA formyltransferase [bacterium]|nr:methionyl-tRNA formyltransferase [bacterium]